MDLAVWRDISLLWLMFLTLFAVLPFGVIFFFGIKGLNKVRQLLKRVLPIAQLKARQAAAGTEQVSIKIAQPVIRAHAVRAQVSAVTRTALRRR